MDRCRAAFREKSFVTAVISGNGHRTAIQRTAFSYCIFVLHFRTAFRTAFRAVFVTVVDALFQELGI